MCIIYSYGNFMFGVVVKRIGVSEEIREVFILFVIMVKRFKILIQLVSRYLQIGP